MSVWRIRWIKDRPFDTHVVGPIPLQSEWCKLRQVNVTDVPEAGIPIVDVVEKRECKSKRREIGDDVGALNADVMLDGVLHHKWVMGWGDREAGVGVREDQRSETWGKKGTRVVYGYDDD